MAVMHSLYREPGIVTIEQDRCKRCGQCVEVCPADVLIMGDGGVIVNSSSVFGCIACGHCMMVCPEGSVTVTGRGISPEDLLPLPLQEDKATAEALGALLRARRSVRRFSDREVDRDLLERVVEMASSAPMGIPPWDIGCVTVHGREQVQKLAVEIVQGYEQFLGMFRPWVLALMRPFMRRASYEQFKYFIRPLAETLVAGRRQGRDVLFWDAPAVMIFHHSPYADTADTAIACTYAMLAAESLGLGTTIIGSAAPVMRRNQALLRAYGIPKGNTPAFAMILGYATTHFKRAVRRHFTSAKAF